MSAIRSLWLTSSTICYLQLMLVMAVGLSLMKGFAGDCHHLGAQKGSWRQLNPQPQPQSQSPSQPVPNREAQSPPQSLPLVLSLPAANLRSYSENESRERRESWYPFPDTSETERKEERKELPQKINIRPKRWGSEKSIKARPMSVERSECNGNSDCVKTQTNCDTKVGRCFCPIGFLPQRGEAPGSHNNEQKDVDYSMFCFKTSSLGEECSADEQCIVRHSVCTYKAPAPSSSSSSSLNNSKSCHCKESHFPEDGFEETRIHGVLVSSKVICHYYEHHTNSEYLGIIMVLGVVALVALSGCVFVVIKIQQRKRRHNQENLQSTSDQTMSTETNGPVDLNVANLSQQQQQQGNSNRLPIHFQRDFTHLPPMGSAAAEFQNDFIQVFPMHHLEPQPEKNSTALNMQGQQ